MTLITYIVDRVAQDMVNTSEFIVETSHVAAAVGVGVLEAGGEMREDWREARWWWWWWWWWSERGEWQETETTLTRHGTYRFR
jgi:hypothetical protein